MKQLQRHFTPQQKYRLTGKRRKNSELQANQKITKNENMGRQFTKLLCLDDDK